MRLPARLVAVSWRDLLVIGLPVLLITAAAAWIAIKFVRPAPPNTIVISAGPLAGLFAPTWVLRVAVRSQNEGAGICGLIIAGYGSITAKDHRIDTIPAFDVTSANHAGGKFK